MLLVVGVILIWLAAVSVFGKVYNHNVSVASSKHLRGVLDGISGAFTPRRVFTSAGKGTGKKVSSALARFLSRHADVLQTCS
jgi:hypothetical protein